MPNPFEVAVNSVKKLASQAQQNRYTFNPLPVGESVIRLVSLQGIDEEGNPKCLLQEAALERTDLNFCCLSYVWGSPWPSHEINVEGSLLSVTANLWMFLHYAITKLKDGQNLFFWIDAVCINQNDGAEKSSQVALMSRVYSRASKVFLWLQGNYRSPTDPSVAYSFDGYSMLAQTIKIGLLPQVIQPSCAFILDAFIQLLNHSIWSRLWIVQELTLAKNAVLLWENQVITWSALRDLIQDVFSSDYPRLSLSQYLCSKDIRTEAARFKDLLPIFDFFPADLLTTTPLGLVDLVLQYGKHQCSITHDRVFALLALAPSKQNLKPDYSDSLSSLLIRVMLYHHQTCKTMLDKPRCKLLLKLLGQEDEMDLICFAIQSVTISSRKDATLSDPKFMNRVPATSRYPPLPAHITSQFTADTPEILHGMRFCDQCIGIEQLTVQRLIWLPVPSLALAVQRTLLEGVASISCIFHVETNESQQNATLHVVRRFGRSAPLISTKNSCKTSWSSRTMLKVDTSDREAFEHWYRLMALLMPNYDIGRICPSFITVKDVVRDAHQD